MEEMEFKKPYFEPSMKVYEMEPICILAGSPFDGQKTEPVNEEDYDW